MPCFSSKVNTLKRGWYTISMPNDFIDARGLANKPNDELLSLLDLINLSKNNKANLTPQENRIDSLFTQPMPVDAKANFIKTLGQDLRNQQNPYEVFTGKTQKTGPTTLKMVKQPGPPKPHTDTSGIDSLFALLALLNGPGMAMKLPAFAKALGLTTPRGIATNAATYFGMPYATNKIQQGVNASRDYLSDPANPLARGLEMLSKSPPTPR